MASLRDRYRASFSSVVPFIEKEPVLSKSTVKIHAEHIYRKCGVSSRQEVLDSLQRFDAADR